VDGAAEAADQKFFIALQFQIQVRAAFHVGQGIIWIIVWIVVAGHVQERDIQKSKQVFKVGIRQIAASHDQLNIAEMTVCAEAVEPFYNFIANCKDFHNGRIVPQNKLPCKEGFSSGISQFVYETEMLPSFGWLSNIALQTIIY